VIRLAWLALLPAVLLVVATPASAADTPVRIVTHGARTQPVVALTFDDGYSVKNCGKILDILQRRKVAATFLPYARAVAGSPTFWRRVADAGYPIANHSTTHPDMTTLTLAEATAEISTARAIVERATGHTMIRVFRPPYGAWDQTTAQAALAAGFPTLLFWEVTDVDTTSASAAGMIKRALKGRNGSVVLLHCGPDATPKILERIIDGYMERGFGFVTVPQLLSGKVPASAFPPAPPPKPRPVKLWIDPDGRLFSLMTLMAHHRFAAWAI